MISKCLESRHSTIPSSILILWECIHTYIWECVYMYRENVHIYKYIHRECIYMWFYTGWEWNIKRYIYENVYICIVKPFSSFVVYCNNTARKASVNPARVEFVDRKPADIDPGSLISGTNWKSTLVPQQGVYGVENPPLRRFLDGIKDSWFVLVLCCSLVLIKQNTFSSSFVAFCLILCVFLFLTKQFVILIWRLGMLGVIAGSFEATFDESVADIGLFAAI